MKKRMIALLVGMALLATCLTGCKAAKEEAAPAGEEKKVLTAAANIDYAPFEFYENGVAVGFDVDLWSAICDKMGYEADFVHFPWDSLISGLKSGKYDAIVADMEITDERLQSVNFTDTYFYETVGIAIAAGSDYTELSDLAGKTVGLQTGTVAENWAKENEASINPEKFTTYETMADAMMDLEVGRIDAVINNGPYMQYQATINDKIKVMKIIDDNPINCGIAYTKDNTELGEQINSTLAELIADGTYAELYKKWFGADPSADFMPK